MIERVASDLVDDLVGHVGQNLLESQSKQPGRDGQSRGNPHGDHQASDITAGDVHIYRPLTEGWQDCHDQGLEENHEDGKDRLEPVTLEVAYRAEERLDIADVRYVFVFFIGIYSHQFTSSSGYWVMKVS